MIQQLIVAMVKILILYYRNVNIKSPSRNIVTNSDNATYNSTENGKLVLTGNAVATQNGNIVRGNTLTVYLGDNVNIK